jgi:hypothetical protein
LTLIVIKSIFSIIGIFLILNEVFFAAFVKLRGLGVLFLSFAFHFSPFTNYASFSPVSKKGGI